MLHYKLRTLLLLLAVGPPMLARGWWAWPKVVETNQQRTRADFDKLIDLITQTIRPALVGATWADREALMSFAAADASRLLKPKTTPFVPDPCGRGYSFTPYFATPYSAIEDDEFQSITATQIVPSADDDPFANPK